MKQKKLLSVFTELCACCVQSSCLRPWTCTVSHAMVDVIGNQINSFPPRIWQFLGELMCRSIQSTWHYPVISMCVCVCVCVCVYVSTVSQSYPTLYDPMDCSPPGSSVHGISQARILGVVCHFLLQGIFAIQWWNPHLLHWQTDALPLSYQRSPIISSIKLVEWMRSRGTRELCEIITL